MKFLVMFILISASVESGSKMTKKKHVRPVLQTTISCQSNYSIVKKIKVWLVELRGMPHQLEKSSKLTKEKNTKLRSNHVFFFLILCLDTQGFSVGCIQAKKTNPEPDFC